MADSGEEKSDDDGNQKEDYNYYEDDEDDVEEDEDSDKSSEEPDYPDEVDEDGNHEDEQRLKKKLERTVLHPAQIDSLVASNDDERLVIEKLCKDLNRSPDGDHEDERRLKKKLKRVVHPPQMDRDSLLASNDDELNLEERLRFGNNINNASNYIKQILVFGRRTKSVWCVKPAELWKKATSQMLDLLTELFVDDSRQSFSISNNTFQVTKRLGPSTIYGKKGTRGVCFKQTPKILVAVVFTKQMRHEECDQIIDNAVDISFTSKGL